MRYELIRTERILAIDPISRGFGFVVLEEDPLQLVDWGIATCRRYDSSVASAVLRLLRRLQPTVLVLEDPRGAISTIRSLAIQRFIANIPEALIETTYPIRLYPRAAVRSLFLRAGVITKHDIARALAGRFPELLSRVLRRRQIWESEDPRLAVFDAAALAVAHLALRGEVVD